MAPYNPQAFAPPATYVVGKTRNTRSTVTQASQVNNMTIPAILNPHKSSNSKAIKKTDSMSPRMTQNTSSKPSNIITTNYGTLLQPVEVPKLDLSRAKGKGAVKYAPYELHEQAFGLTQLEQNELARQHRRFRIVPAHPNHEAGDSIADHARYVSYASDKRTFTDKTGRTGFSRK